MQTPTQQRRAVITLASDLHREAKVAAAMKGKSLTEFASDIMRAALTEIRQSSKSKR